MRITAMTMRTNNSIMTQRVDGLMIKFIQEQIDGLFEVMYLPGGCPMFINEDGLRLNLTFNRIATAMTNGGTMTTIDPSSHPYITGAIVGNAVITGPVNTEGDETDCPPMLIAQAIRLLGQR